MSMTDVLVTITIPTEAQDTALADLTARVDALEWKVATLSAELRQTMDKAMNDKLRVMTQEVEA